MPASDFLFIDSTSLNYALTWYGAGVVIRGRVERDSLMQEVGLSAKDNIPLALSRLEAAGMSLAKLKLMVVNIGPGSYTGLRAALAAASGLALSLGVPSIGVSTFHLLRALGFSALGVENFGEDAPLVLAAVDNGKGGWFAQLFKGYQAGPAFDFNDNNANIVLKDQLRPRVSPGGAPLELTLVGPLKAAKVVTEGAGDYLRAGRVDCEELLRPEQQIRLLKACLEQEPYWSRLGIQRADPKKGEFLSPLYIKAPNITISDKNKI